MQLKFLKNTFYMIFLFMLFKAEKGNSCWSIEARFYFKYRFSMNIKRDKHV